MIQILAQASSGDVMEIVRNVHDFYNQAWGNLLWAVGCIGAVAAAMLSAIGFLVPWWLERVRRESFRLDKEAVLREVDDVKADMTRQLTESTEIYKEKLKEALQKISETEDRVTRNIEEHAGDLWAVHGLTMGTLGSEDLAMFCRTFAVKSHLNAGSKQSLDKAKTDLAGMADICRSLVASKRPPAEALRVSAEVVLGVIREIEGGAHAATFAEPLEAIKAYLQPK